VIAAVPYPRGVTLVLDADTKPLPGGALSGGSPTRVLRLSAAGQIAWIELRAGRVGSAAGASLARRLTDVGMLHPVCPPVELADVTVVIPVRDRCLELARCLDAIGGEVPVIVVDDASNDPRQVAAVCANYGASLISRPTNGGPSAARTTGLAGVNTSFVLLLDSDTVAPRDLIASLAGHFADPLVAAVAPRIVALPGGSLASRYGMTAGSLDLGSRPARVAPGTRLSHVPTAALLVRRAALEEVGGFDVNLRYGEDVDLVWRLDAAGWRVRYEPLVTVHHAEPTRWLPLLRRRYRYGTSAGPLARRHPGKLTPVVLHSWSLLAAAGVLLRRPSIGVVGLAGSVLTLRRTLRGAGLDHRGAALESVKTAALGWRQLGRAVTQFGTPVLAAVAAMGGGGARRRRLAIAALVLTGPLSEWRSRPATLGPLSFVGARLADEVAYGSGVIVGSIRAGTLEPLRPVLTGRMLRIPARAVRSAPPSPTPSPAPDLAGLPERSIHA
jgi:mycofactocin system glycosyltransferase